MKHWIQHLMRRSETKASATAPLLVMGGAHQPLWTPRQYDSLAEEGYQKKHCCVSMCFVDCSRSRKCSVEAL